MDTERRKTSRKKPEQLVYVEFDRDNGGMMRDLSEGGIGFRAVGPVQPGQKVQFSFSFDAGKQLAGDAELIWTDAGGRAGGLRFLDAAEDVRSQIRARIARAEYPAATEQVRAMAAALPSSTLEELRKELRGETAPAVAEGPVPEERERISAEVAAGASGALPVEARREESAAAMPPAGIPELSPLVAARPPLEKEIMAAQEPAALLGQEIGGSKWLEKVTLEWAVGAMLVCTVLAATFVYHHEVGESLIWLGQRIAGGQGTAQSPVPQQPALPADSGTDGPASSAASPGTTQEKPAVSPAPPAAGTDGAHAGGTVPEVRQLADHDASAYSGPAAPPKAEDNGQSEFQQALRILRGEGQSDNPGEAARLLWVAVERGNSAAEVALAEMYRKGEGVTQSCDQTMVLLTAAAKKGNGQAKTRLAEISQTGCP
jgi:hypothetical protein